MNILDEMQKYNRIYEVCFNKIFNLLEKERNQYTEFLFENNISVVRNITYDHQEGYLYIAPQGNLTKEEVEKMYKLWKK